MRRKLTEQELQAEIRKIRDLGNPEIDDIMHKMEERITTINNMISTHFATRVWQYFVYQNEDRHDRRWIFSAYIAPKSTDVTDDSYDAKLINNHPKFACVEFNLEITIPMFTGRNLDIPDGKRINFNLCHWDIWLIHPYLDFKTKDDLCERLNLATSLHHYSDMFRLDAQFRAYIMYQFDNFVRFYGHYFGVRNGWE